MEVCLSLARNLLESDFSGRQLLDLDGSSFVGLATGREKAPY